MEVLSEWKLRKGERRRGLMDELCCAYIQPRLGRSGREGGKEAGQSELETAESGISRIDASISSSTTRSKNKLSPSK